MKQKFAATVLLSLCLMVFGAILHTTPAFAATINVTTSTDEDSAPAAGSGCSIYEAVQAANTNAAYGGCVAGSGTDTISIPSGTYAMLSGNTWSDNIDITETAVLTGPSTGSKPVIDGMGKFHPKFNLLAADMTVSNLEFAGYDLQNWDPASLNSFPNLTLDNLVLSAQGRFNRNEFDTNNEGLRASNISLRDGYLFDIYADDAVVTHMTGDNYSWFETGVDDANETGGDDISVRDVVFTNNSTFYLDKNGPGLLLLEDISIDTTDDNALYIFSLDGNDDGTTIFRRLTVKNTDGSPAILYENDNTTGRHVLKVEDSLFEDNDYAIEYADQGAERSVPSLVVTGSVFRHNGPYSGNIVLWDPEGYMQIDRSSFIGNTMDTWSGAGIYSDGRVDVTNSTFYDNKPVPTTGYPGGAVYLGVAAYKNGTASPVASRFINNTFVNNDADAGSGVYIADYNDSTSSRDTDLAPVMINNLFSGNAGAACHAGSAVGASSSNRYAAQFDASSAGNISTDTSCDGATVVADAKIDASLTDATTANRVGYASSGGYLPILRLANGSPAIDTGRSLGCPAVDQATTPRPQGNACDVGAFETLGLSSPPAPGSSGPLAPGTGLGGVVHMDIRMIAGLTGSVLAAVIAVEIISRRRDHRRHVQMKGRR